MKYKNFFAHTRYFLLAFLALSLSFSPVSAMKDDQDKTQGIVKHQKRTHSVDYFTILPRDILHEEVFAWSDFDDVKNLALISKPLHKEVWDYIISSSSDFSLAFDPKNYEAFSKSWLKTSYEACKNPLILIKIFDYRQNLVLPDELDWLPSKAQNIHFPRYPTDKRLKSLSPFVTSLKKIKFDIIGENQDLQGLSKFTNLTVIDVRDTNITDNGFQHISALTNLTKINFRKTKITNAGLKHLSGLTNLTKVNGFLTAIDDDALPYLSNLTNLQVLDLGETDIGNLTYVTLLTNLEKLSLFKTLISETDLSSLSSLSKLKKLELSYTVEIKNLSSISSLTNIRKLGIMGSPYGPSDWQYIAPFKKLEWICINQKGNKGAWVTPLSLRREVPVSLLPEVKN